MKIKSEFSILALFLHLLLIAVSVLAYREFSPVIISGEIGAGDFLFYILIPLYAVFTLFALLSPFTSIKRITIDESMITYRYLLYKKSYDLKSIDGCFTMEVPSRDTTYETVYPVSRNRILPSISSFYISDYEEVKEALPIKNPERVKFSWRNYMLIVLFKKYNELDR